jgi:hypothetical protein
VTTILARTFLFAGVGILPALAGNQALLRNLTSSDGAPAVLAAEGSYLFVVSTLSTSDQQISRVVHLDLNGTQLASLDLPQLAVPAAATTDFQGEVILVGAGQQSQGLVVKVNAARQSVTTLASLPASLRVVALDSSGNIYVTDFTGSTTFPVTAGAYRTKPPLNFGSAEYAFLTEISPAGQIVYSTYFGSDATTCIGGSFCVGRYGLTNGTAIAVDASGAVIIAGITTADGLPTTADVVAQRCVCGHDFGLGTGYYAGFVAKFQPGATQQLEWSTFLNASESRTQMTLNSLALDSAGNVIVGGGASDGLPTTAATFRIPALGSSASGGAYASMVNGAATAVTWGTYFGSETGAVQSICMDGQGRVVLSGYPRPSLGTLPYQPTFVGRVTGDGSTLVDFYEGPEIHNLVPNCTNQRICALGPSGEPRPWSIRTAQPSGCRL